MRVRWISPLVLLALTLTGPAWAAKKSATPSTPQAGPSTPAVQAPPPNDTCEGAILLTCGNISLSGSTDQATNNYAFVDTANSCTGYASYGKDVVYKLNVGVGDSLWINYQNVADGSIYLVSDCNDVDGSCVAGSDDSSNPGTTESLRYRFVVSGIYYLILDSYGLNTSGVWTASGQLICGPQTPPPNDLCEIAPTLPCGTFELSGSTQYAHNNYTFPSAFGSCTGFTEEGRDVVYRLNITAGDSLRVFYTSQTANGAVYIIADCNDEVNTCVWGEDQNTVGEPEDLRYKFPFSGVYYLILDSRGAESFSNWTATGTLVCANPPPPNDRCVDALPIPCGAINWSGNTHFATNDYYFGENTACTGYPADGRDVVYRLDAYAGDTLHVDYRALTSDATMYLVTDCSDVVTSCVVGVDQGVFSDYETLHWVFTTNGTYYLILDTVDPDAWSEWVATGYRRGYCTLLDVDPRLAGPRLELRGVTPNPFHGRTHVFFELSAAARVALKIHDLQGRVVRTLVDGDLAGGPHQALWDGRDDSGQRVGPGIFFARLTSGAQSASRRMIFVR